MLKIYSESILVYKEKKISIRQERRLIALAQKGCEKSTQEIVLRHVGFLIYRIHQKLIPSLLYKHKDDMVSLGVIILYEKIKTYNSKYRDKQGVRKPVRFVSYIWKRVDGFIVDYLKEEFKQSDSLDNPNDIWVVLRVHGLVSKKRLTKRYQRGKGKGRKWYLAGESPAFCRLHLYTGGYNRPMKPIRLSGHAVSRLALRGGAEDEVISAIREAKWEGAKQNRLRCRKSFPYGKF